MQKEFFPLDLNDRLPIFLSPGQVVWVLQLWESLFSWSANFVSSPICYVMLGLEAQNRPIIIGSNLEDHVI